MVRQQGEFDVIDRGADGLGAVVQDLELDPRRHRGAQNGQGRLDAVHRLDDIGARLLEDDQQDAFLAVHPGDLLGVFRPVDGLADILDLDRRAVPIGDHRLVPRGGLEQLIVGIDGEVARIPVQRALRRIDGEIADGVAHVFQAEIHIGQLGRIDLDADGRLLLAGDGDDADTGHAADLLRHDSVGEIVDRGPRQRVRGHRQQQDRRVGRVDLAVARRVGKVLRQLAGSRVDGGLHILGGGVDIAVEIELQDHIHAAQAGRGQHLRHAGNLRELAFERRGHRGRHGLRIGAGQAGIDLDGGEIDLRQLGDGQQRKGDHAGQQDRRHQQGGGDRPLDEGFGDIHPFTASARISTLLPVSRRYWPLVTTVSPSVTPLVTTTTPSLTGPIWIERCSRCRGRP